MNIGERLREERERLGLSQPVFGEIGGVQKLAQSNYEQGKRAPDADYLAAVAASGVDVRYVVTGERDYTPPPALSAEEQTMLEYFRQATPAVRRAALGALIGAPAESGGASVKASVKKSFLGFASAKGGKKE